MMIFLHEFEAVFEADAVHVELRRKIAIADDRQGAAVTEDFQHVKVFNKAQRRVEGRQLDHAQL